MYKGEINLLIHINNSQGIVLTSVRVCKTTLIVFNDEKRHEISLPVYWILPFKILNCIMTLFEQYTCSLRN